jgi:Ca-activated chloride channel family protein
MVQTRYPSDAHLARTSAESVYGTADKHGHLANTVVLWAYRDESLWASQYHKDRASRFWSLLVASQGPNAMLAGFSSDTAQVLLQSLRADNRPIGTFAVDPSDSALVMHVADERAVPVESTRAKATPPPQPTPQPAITTPPPAAPEPVAATLPTPPPPKVQQALKPPPSPAPVLVTLDVGVTDSARTPIAGLSREDFTVLEDRVKQDITSFNTERTPISLVLLIDTSGSIGSKLDRIRAAASTIIHQCGDQDEFCVIEFKADVSVIQDFTSAASSADRALASLKAGGGTALLDSLKFGLEYANQKGKHERKGVLLITDGGEADSHSTRAEVIPLLQQGNVQFYSIAFPEGLGPAQAPDSRSHGPVKAQPTEALARNLLDTLAKASSGGLVFYPRQGAELGRIAQSIVSDLRAPRYTLGYYPVRPQTDAGWRSVHVQVRPSAEHGPLTARTRSGYFAGQPGPANASSAGTADANPPIP